MVIVLTGPWPCLSIYLSLSLSLSTSLSISLAPCLLHKLALHMTLVAGIIAKPNDMLLLLFHENEGLRLLRRAFGLSLFSAG